MKPDNISIYPHQLYHDDNVKLLKKITKKYANSIKLIYLDPPFGTNKTYYSHEQFLNENNEIELNQIIAYDDFFSEKDYYEYIKKLVRCLYNLLSDDGFLVFQCDSNYNYIIRTVLNYQFGVNNFRGEIIINVETRDLFPDMGNINKLRQNHNVIFIFSKYDKTILPEIKTEKVIKRKSQWFPLITNGIIAGNNFPIMGITPLNCSWKWNKTSVDLGIENYNNYLKKNATISFEEYVSNNICKNYVRKENNTVEYYYNNLNDIEAINESYWFDIKYRGYETNYPTEKNIELIDRIILWLSKDNDIVLDPFMGSGTTLISCEKLNRICIGIDKNRNSIELSKKRLIEYRQDKI